MMAAFDLPQEKEWIPAASAPDGKYLIALNKIAKDSYLSVGPEYPFLVH